MTDNNNHTFEEVGRLFRTYIRVLNAEFGEHRMELDAAIRECQELTEALCNIGFTVVVQTVSMAYTLQPAPGILQEITDLTHHLVLMPTHLNPYDPKDAILRIATARSRIFGSCSSSQVSPNPPTPEQERWLRSQLDSLLTDP